MKKSRTVLLVSLSCLFAFAVFGLTGCNRERAAEAARVDRTQSLSPAEQEFMTKAAEANLSEIEAARLALQKSEDIAVREYARMVQGDHMNALADLSDMMKDQRVPEPEGPAPAAAKDIARAEALTGAEFDREYINMAVAEHQKAVELFRDQAETARNADLRRYVELVLPKLEMHLEKAQRLQSKLFASLKEGLGVVARAEVQAAAPAPE